MLKIFTIVNTRPDLLELQLRSFSKNLMEEFEFIVINNGLSLNKESLWATNTECARLNLKCVTVETNRPYAGMTDACYWGVQWAWQNVISKEKDSILLMHHDMFLLKPTTLTQFVTCNTPLAFVPQSRYGVPVHLWEGFVLADMSRIPDAADIDWDYGFICDSPVDVGGMSHYWFQAHPDLSWMAIQPVHTEDTPDVDFHPARFEYLHFYGEPLVLHYRAASDWMKLGPDYHRKKTEWLKKQLS